MLTLGVFFIITVHNAAWWCKSSSVLVIAVVHMHWDTIPPLTPHRTLPDNDYAIRFTIETSILLGADKSYPCIKRALLAQSGILVIFSGILEYCLSETGILGYPWGIWDIGILVIRNWDIAILVSFMFDFGSLRSAYFNILLDVTVALGDTH